MSVRLYQAEIEYVCKACRGDRSTQEFVQHAKTALAAGETILVAEEEATALYPILKVSLNAAEQAQKVGNFIFGKGEPTSLLHLSRNVVRKIEQEYPWLKETN